MRSLCLAASLLAVGCFFDRSGVGGADDVDAGDDVPPDAAPDGPTIDGPIDAAPIDAAPIDAVPIDAMPIDADPDSDDDTVLDVLDNCDLVPNLDQHDEDGDLVGDVCDNCPHVANPDQADDTEGTPDGVGDVCDPRPDDPDTIALFEPFKGPGLPAGWTAVRGNWTVAGDELMQTSATPESAYFYYDAGDWTAMTVATIVDADDVPPDPPGGGAQLRSVGALMFYAAGAANGTGYLCTVYDNVDSGANADVYVGELADNGTIGSIQATQMDFDMATGQTYGLTGTVATGGVMSCTAVTPNATTFQATDSDTSYTSGTVALRTNTVGASYRYVVVIVPAN